MVAFLQDHVQVHWGKLPSLHDLRVSLSLLSHNTRGVSLLVECAHGLHSAGSDLSRHVQYDDVSMRCGILSVITCPKRKMDTNSYSSSYTFHP